MRLLAVLGVVGLLAAACSGVKPPEEGGSSITYSLPRTSVQLEVSWELQGCRTEWDTTEQRWRVALDTVPSVTMNGVYAPDPDARVSIPFSVLNGWFVDSKVAVEVYASGVVQSVGSATADRVPAIASNVFQTAGRVARMVAGVPTGGGLGTLVSRPPPEACGPARALIAEVRRLQARLADPAVDEKVAAAIQRAIERNQARLVVRTTARLDPRVVMGDGEAVTVDIRSLSVKAQLPAEAVQRAGWLTNAAFERNFTRNSNGGWVLSADADALSVMAALDVDTATLRPAHRSTFAFQGSHWRDPALIRVRAYRSVPGVGETAVGSPREFAFGQFGAPRNLPFTAGRFESLDWKLTFREDGRLTSQSFGSVARGVAASGMLLDATQRAQDALGPISRAGTTELQNALADVKARGDLIEQQQRLRRLQAESGAGAATE